MAFKGWVIDPTIIDWRNRCLKEGFSPLDIFSEAEYEDYQDIYKVLSHEEKKVSMFSIVYFPRANNDGVFVDEEGLFPGQQYWFKFTGGHQPFGGKGFILGENDEGESISPQVITKEWLLENVTVAAQNVEISFQKIDGEFTAQSKVSINAPIVQVWLANDSFGS